MISVVIPVYNTAQFVVRACHSALEQAYCDELILIEDGSTDESLTICKKLSSENEKVKCFTHPFNQNRGAGASRNLGLQKTKNQYVAFLDADDYYMPGFFEKAIENFRKDEQIDFVFGTLGADYEDDQSKLMHLKDNDRDESGLKFEYHYKSGNLLYFLQLPDSGHLLLSGMVIKRSLLNRIGYFDETLIQSQDGDLIWRMAWFGKGIGLDPSMTIAKKGVHRNNRVFNTKQKQEFIIKTYDKWLFRNVKKFKLPADICYLMLKNAIHVSAQKYIGEQKMNRILIVFLKLIFSIKYFIYSSSLIFRIINHFAKRIRTFS